MKKGPEQELADRYFDRFAKSATPLGLGFAKLYEIPESRAQTASQRMEEEGARLLEFLGETHRLIVLDERGKTMGSPEFSDKIALMRDNGTRNLTIALGGPDGHAEKIRQQADLLLSFGSMTWPHQIARILIAEQLYRASTILSGHPYHRV